MTFHEYVAEIHAAMTRYPLWRFGQAAFNVLQVARRDLSDQIVRGSKLDPFYRDDRTEKFPHWVQRHWNDRSDFELTAKLDELRY